MKKRNIALVMAGLMAAMSLTGCSGGAQEEASADGAAKTEAAGSEAADGGEKSLTVAWWGNQVRNERTQQMLELYSEQNPGVTFDGQFSEWNDYWNKLATASAGHTMPDIVQMDMGYYNQYVENGLLLDLSPYIEDGTLEVADVDESILESAKIDGKTYGICNGINAPALLYNKTLLDEAGI